MTDLSTALLEGDLENAKDWFMNQPSDPEDVLRTFDYRVADPEDCNWDACRSEAYWYRYYNFERPVDTVGQFLVRLCVHELWAARLSGTDPDTPTVNIKIDFTLLTPPPEGFDMGLEVGRRYSGYDLETYTTNPIQVITQLHQVFQRLAANPPPDRASIRRTLHTVAERIMER